MTDGETKRVATAAAKEALQEFLLMLGVDVSKPEGVIALQKDFHHMRTVRETMQEVRGAVRSKVIDHFTGAAVTAVMGALGLYFFHH